MSTPTITPGQQALFSTAQDHNSTIRAERVEWGATPILAEHIKPGTAAPYQPGERVQVFVGFPKRTGGTYFMWHDAVIIACDQPRGARRFVCSVSIGTSIHDCYLTTRVYCNADGRGDEIRPLVDALLEEEED